MLKDEVRLQEYVDNGFKKLFFNIPKEERAEYNGIQLINSAVITRYLKQLLENGGGADTPANVESLFLPDKKRSAYVFQTFLYASIVCRKLREKGSDLRVAPSLLYIHRAASQDYSPVIRMGEPRKRKKKEAVEDFSQYENLFRENLNQLLEVIFNPEIAFNQTDNEDKCSFCDFRGLCKR